MAGEMPRAMPRNAAGGLSGSSRSPPLNSTTISLAPGSSFMRRLTSSGITTWNFGETVTVVISINISYDGLCVDTDLGAGSLLATAASPRPLGDIQPDHRLSEYTTELLTLLGLLVDLEPQAAELLERICSGLLFSEAELRMQGVFFPEGHVPATVPAQQSLGIGPEEGDAAA